MYMCVYKGISLLSMIRKYVDIYIYLLHETKNIKQSYIIYLNLLKKKTKKNAKIGHKQTEEAEREKQQISSFFLH